MRNPQLTFMLSGEWLNTYFPLRSAARQPCLLLPLLFNVVLEILGRAISQEKEIKRAQARWLSWLEHHLYTRKGQGFDPQLGCAQETTEQGCPTRGPWATCSSGWLECGPTQNRKFTLKYYKIFLWLHVAMYLMCGPRHLSFFQCGPETPKGWTPLFSISLLSSPFPFSPPLFSSLSLPPSYQ